MTREYVLETGLQASERLEIQNQMHLKDHTAILKKAGLKEGMIVCDIGCGNGTMTQYLAEQVGKSGKVYAIDISKAQIDVARKRIKDASLDNVEFIQADITSDILDIKADLIFIRLVLMHLKEPSLAIKSMKNILNPNGVVVSFESIMDDALNRTESAIIQEYVMSILKLGQMKEQNYSLGKILPELYNNEAFKVESFNLEPELPKEYLRLFHLFIIEELSEALKENNLASQGKIDAFKEAFQNLTLEEIGLEKLRGTMVIARK